MATYGDSSMIVSPPHDEEPDSGSRSCAIGSVCPDCGVRFELGDPTFACPECGAGVDIDYDYDQAAAKIEELPLAARPQNIWRFEEMLPIVDADAIARVGQFSGHTPLIHAERLGAELGLTNLYLKDDSSNHPSFSYKDRVVSMAIARLLELDRTEIGCVSTGNVGTAVAALAAHAGIRPYVFYPSNLEPGKVLGCRALGAEVCQLEGNYDEVNRACRELARASGLDFANITLRPFYAEGAKTLAYEVVEQLKWESPDHMVIPAAGGTLSSRVHKGLEELERVGLSHTASTKIHIAQAAGCSPLVAAIRTDSETIAPQNPETVAHSLAIGAPGDGGLVLEAVRNRGGSAASATDYEIFDAIGLLAATEGVLTEPAGGATLAGTMKLVAEGTIAPTDSVVVTITGNGLKTLSEHPRATWPENVACETGAMKAVLDDFRYSATAGPTGARGRRAEWRAGIS